MNPLCISNIAWNEWDDAAVFSLLRENGVVAQELAPGKIWKDLKAVAADDLAEKKRYLEEEGFVVPAFQAILFGHPEWNLFVKSCQPEIIEHLKTVSELAMGLGAKVLVFGAPGCRRRNALSWRDAFELGAEFFRKAGEAVAENGCVLGLEANPADYKCDFLTNVNDLVSFVRHVDSPGVQVHFDTGATSLNKEDVSAAIRTADKFVHYHISESMLANIADGVVDHESAFKTLRAIGYDGYVSIEMKRGEGDDLENLKRALDKVRRSMDEAR